VICPAVAASASGEHITPAASAIITICFMPFSRSAALRYFLLRRFLVFLPVLAAVRLLLVFVVGTNNDSHTGRGC
jgi:hypothetical protein